MSVKLGNTNISSILGSSGASSGTTDYTDLTNKPSINGVSLVGNKTSSDLGITLSTDNFYTKDETNNKINTEVTAAVQPKADKTYVDTQLNLKVSNSDFNNALALKADKSNTYTKTETNAEINSAISTKADISYVNTALDSKVSISDVYDKDEINTQLDILENSIDNKLETKADKTTTYTKTEVDTAISTAVANRATTTYVDTGLATKANQETTYTKTEIDNLISGMGPTGDTLPVGAIIPYSGQTTPENWLLCDGREVSRTIYSQLFNVIGTIYGAGDGSTSFNLPNLKDRVPVGTSNNITLGQKLGEKEHTLTLNETPQHRHTLNNNGTEELAITVNALSGGNNYNMNYTGGASENGPYVRTNFVGGGQAHNNMQPSIGQNYIIKAKQSAGLIATVVDRLTSTSVVDALSANQGRLLDNRITDAEPVVVYANNSGSNGAITLSDDIKNYKKTVIQFITDHTVNSTTIYNDNANIDKVSLLGVAGDGTAGWIKYSVVSITGTALTVKAKGNINVYGSGGTSFTSNENSTYITKVVCYK